MWAWISPSVWAWRHPGCGPGDTLGVGLETPWVWAWKPLGVGLETPQGQTPQLPPWLWAWKPARHAGIAPPGDLQGMLGYHLQFMLGCVLPAAVAICRGMSASVYARIPPRCGPGDIPVWAWRSSWCEPGDPPGVGLETPWRDPSTSPLGVHLETCKAC